MKDGNMIAFARKDKAIEEFIEKYQKHDGFAKALKDLMKYDLCRIDDTIYIVDELNILETY